MLMIETTTDKTAHLSMPVETYIFMAEAIFISVLAGSLRVLSVHLSYRSWVIL